GPRPVGCFSALLARPVWIQIWALHRQSGSDRLEKQPTDLRRHHHYMRDGTLEVITVRTWKEYVEESLLIVFSVVLALLLTTLFQKLHENKQTREVLHELREEIITNKKSEEIQLSYHLQVLKNIDSALADPAIAQKFINNGALNLKIIAPEGVLCRDLNEVAWEVAKQNNIFAKLDLRTYSLLTNIYGNQQRITKAEDEISKVLESWESRKPENLRTTLILIKDNYLG